MTVKRLDWIDNLRGFGMILVVWGHMNLPYIFETIIYSFHIPLFFFISGYLYRAKKECLVSAIKRKASGTLVPYLFFAALSIPFGIILSLLQNTTLSISNIIINYFYLNGSVGWNSPLWFLVVLFFIEIVYIIIDTLEWNNLFLVILFFTLGYSFSQTHLEFPFGLNIVCYGIVFYYLGHLIKTIDIEKRWFLNKFKKISALSILALINILFGLFLNSRVSVYHNELGNYFWFYIASVSACLAFYLIFKSTKRVQLLTFIGLNSVVIMCTHYFFKFTIILADRLLGGILSVERLLLISMLETAIILVCSVPLCLFFNRNIPGVIGKKRL
ncbi:acyltransferase family protein [Listeria booriae]|uniref:Acyltransferase family protein n=1 Tax=Listeria booriae TaxID=1552123 RepID=A0A7X0XSE0_9LIST|nr:acyltransferase family protein [Listeria booriae]MBC1779165.1 acyltransferase family protein [Listeria booriae]